MSTNEAVLGIDFGTTNSTAASVGPGGKPVALRDAEGLDKTPSIVYYGEQETLVGQPADDLLEEGVAFDPDIHGRLIASVKRELLNPRIALPDGRSIRPVDVAADVLRKIRTDAEESLGGREIQRAAVTCPAVFDTAQRDAILNAALAAGFSEVELLEEPVAAALAFAHGNPVGNGVLVYDFGGGTFDAAFVAREDGDTRFELVLEPDGDAQCGGDDLDVALYNHWDALARERLGRSLSGLNGQTHTPILRKCRRRKENLSKAPHSSFSDALPGGDIFAAEITRSRFEELIGPQVERTVEITTRMTDRARAESFDVDTILLVGGSSQVPLVKRQLEEQVDANVLSWGYRDVAVAIGAALHAEQLWRPKKAPSKPRKRAKRAPKPQVVKPVPVPQPVVAGGFDWGWLVAAPVIGMVVGSALGAC